MSEPFAYGIQAPIGSVTPLFHKRKDAEDYIAKLTDSRDEAKIIPLYREPPLYELSGKAENVDWTDIAMSGRAYADNIVGEPRITELMHMMANEIERLRAELNEEARLNGAGASREARLLAIVAEKDCKIARLRVESEITEAEREAVEWAAKAAADPTPVAWYAPQIAATLRGLLERLGGGR